MVSELTELQDKYLEADFSWIDLGWEGVTWVGRCRFSMTIQDRIGLLSAKPLYGTSHEVWPKVSWWFLSLRGTKQSKLIAHKKHERFTNVFLIRFAKNERIMQTSSASDIQPF